MANEKKKSGKRVPDVAAQRRTSKGGQLRHNPEKPFEENRDPAPASRRKDKQ
jgi:hypothetical protein